MKPGRPQDKHEESCQSPPDSPFCQTFRQRVGRPKDQILVERDDIVLNLKCVICLKSRFCYKV